MSTHLFLHTRIQLSRRFFSTSPCSSLPRVSPRVSRPPISLAGRYPEDSFTESAGAPSPPAAPVSNPRHSAPLETLVMDSKVGKGLPKQNPRHTAPLESLQKSSDTAPTQPISNPRHSAPIDTPTPKPSIDLQKDHLNDLKAEPMQTYVPPHATRHTKSKDSTSPKIPEPESQLQKRPPRERASKFEHALPVYQTKYTLRWETEPPTNAQLDQATRFFTQFPPKFLWSAEKFKKIDYGEVPEVAFLGRSNVGKSSLLNALLNHHSMATTSSKPGRTRLMNAFSICQGKLVLLDMPGYGHASRPEWGVQIMKYLLSRKQFRRAFLLIDSEHGPKETDFQMLDHLGASGIPYQVVLSKIDKVHHKPEQLQAAFNDLKKLLTDRDHRRGTSVLGEIIATASSPAKKGEVKIGMPELRWAVMVAAGLDGTTYH